jgi:hypothetical protein
VWQNEVYRGSGGGSWMGAWSRPDAHTVQYRLYREVRGQVLTDGILYQFEVRPMTMWAKAPSDWYRGFEPPVASVLAARQRQLERFEGQGIHIACRTVSKYHIADGAAAGSG